MCYETAQLVYNIYKEAKRSGASEEEILELRTKWERLKNGGLKFYHVSGFTHPKLAAFSSKEGHLDVDYYNWGLIPHWVKDEMQAKQLWDKTLNARGETIFEKPSFRDAARKSRCILPLDGFYEHPHKAGKTFPYFIRRLDKQPLLVGGLVSEWVNEGTGEILKTTSIVTTQANPLMKDIHNNPKLKEARMPLVLRDEDARRWLEGNEQEAMKLIKPSNEALEAIHSAKIAGFRICG